MPTVLKPECLSGCRTIELVSFSIVLEEFNLSDDIVPVVSNIIVFLLIQVILSLLIV